MTENRLSWVRQVTVATLDRFRHVLRTPVERKTRRSLPDKASEEEIRSQNQINALFGDTSIDVPPQFHSRPLHTGTRQNALPDAASPGSKQPPGISTPVIESHSAETKLRWYKRMSRSDAQKPPGEKSNPTGHLTLVQARHPIDHSSWFKDVLFAGQDWKKEPFGEDDRDVAEISFDITTDEEYLGEITLRVVYTPDFEAGQGNRTTALHWGQIMGDRLRENDYTKFFVTIERTTDDTFVMVIDHEPNGEFMG